MRFWVASPQKSSELSEAIILAPPRSGGIFIENGSPSSLFFALSNAEHFAQCEG
jgi:hypothetical protein